MSMTFEDCLLISSKYTKIVDFEKEHPELYQLSLENKWIYKFPNLRKPNGFWTRERIIDCMSLYDDYKTFYNEQWGANKAIRFHKWDDLKDLLNAGSRTHWNYDSAYKEAQKYEYRKDFMIGCPGAYSWMKRNNFLDDCEWLLNGKQRAGEKRRLETANKYKDGILQHKPRKSKINETERIKRLSYEVNDNIVYAYVFEKEHAIYIGRTIKADVRDLTHRKDVTSAVYKFATENIINIPDMTIIESDLSLIDSLDREDYYVNKYREDGWNVLNSGKTGINSGSIGSIGAHSYVTYEQCYRKAQQYTTVAEFKKKANTAYKRSHKTGWWRDYTWLYSSDYRSPYWTYERCHEECMKYTSRISFAKGSPSAYRRAKAEGWLDEWMPLTKEAKWNYETVHEVAEKCNTLKEFRELYPIAYATAYNKNWIDDFKWLERINLYPAQIRIVQQFSLDGTLIAEYNNVAEASSSTNIQRNLIYGCCSGKLKTTHGFIWKYKYDKD